jgi:hypothetical protein
MKIHYKIVTKKKKNQKQEREKFEIGPAVEIS